MGIKDNQLDFTRQTPAALNIDWSTGSTFTKQISATSVFTFSNLIDGKNIIVMINNTSASSVTVSWPAIVKWSEGAVMGSPIAAGKTNLFSFYYDATLGIVVGNALTNIS